MNIRRHLASAALSFSLLLALLSAAAPLARAGSIADAAGNDLVALDGKRLKAFDRSKLAGITHFAIYYSAHWCPPCRKFTPELVSAYKELKAKHPGFELIFVSSDRSEQAMEGYMQETGMPWPALAFDKKKSNGALTRYSGPGIPCLVFLDASGKVLADSYAGEEYLGPHSVLDAIKKTLADAPASAKADAGASPAPGGLSNASRASELDKFFKKAD